MAFLWIFYPEKRFLFPACSTLSLGIEKTVFEESNVGLQYILDNKGKKECKANANRL